MLCWVCCSTAPKAIKSLAGVRFGECWYPSPKYDASATALGGALDISVKIVLNFNWKLAARKSTLATLSFLPLCSRTDLTVHGFHLFSYNFVCYGKKTISLRFHYLQRLFCRRIQKNLLQFHICELRLQTISIDNVMILIPTIFAVSDSKMYSCRCCWCKLNDSFTFDSIKLFSNDLYKSRMNSIWMMGKKCARQNKKLCLYIELNIRTKRKRTIREPIPTIYNRWLVLSI